MPTEGTWFDVQSAGILNSINASQTLAIIYSNFVYYLHLETMFCMDDFQIDDIEITFYVGLPCITTIKYFEMMALNLTKAQRQYVSSAAFPEEN